MSKKLCYTLFFLLVLTGKILPSIQEKTHELTQDNNKVMCITIPQSGTHLLMKCITLLGIQDLSFEYWKSPHNPGLKTTLKQNNETIALPIEETLKYWKTPVHNNNNINNTKISRVHENRALARHLVHSPEAEKFVSKHTYANFFVLRDPRAQLVSQAFTFRKADISFEKMLIDAIMAHEESFLPIQKHPMFSCLYWKMGLYEFYNQYLPWINVKNFYTVKFENLVGIHGGGTLEAQAQEIKNIGKHLGLELTDQKIIDIQNNLYGNTGTFRTGKIDDWKQYFTPAVKQAFKSRPELLQLLINLGYEKDTSW